MSRFVGRLRELLEPLIVDKRTGPVHLCVYLALLQCSQGREGWFTIDREEVMRLAKVSGLTTYYRVMKELVDLGVVEYRASRNWKRASRVRIFDSKAIN